MQVNQYTNINPNTEEYSDGKGDYTKEKYENLEELTIEDFEKILAENN